MINQVCMGYSSFINQLFKISENLNEMLIGLFLRMHFKTDYRVSACQALLTATFKLCYICLFFAFILFFYLLVRTALKCWSRFRKPPYSSTYDKNVYRYDIRTFIDIHTDTIALQLQL